ncbi:23S rRNA (adenine(2030)-N(6))-methyltransferase RlmJ [Roseivivax sp. CAU 1753]
MLSYQHAYHAGNAADLHKHGLLAVMLNYLMRKDKPLSYIETHAGRGLYDLRSPEALKTGEAAAGVGRIALPETHPLARALTAIRARHGPDAYPGSPLIAETLLRDTDSLHLAELHPAEYAALARVTQTRTLTHHQDGFDLAHSLTPPDPRRGLLLCDPSYEVKADYTAIPRHLAQLHRKWNVGILALWYPILRDARHAPMVRTLKAQFPDALCSEVAFAPARDGHGMVGSGLFVVNPPWGLADAARALADLIQT